MHSLPHLTGPRPTRRPPSGPAVLWGPGKGRGGVVQSGIVLGKWTGSVDGHLPPGHSVATICKPTLAASIPFPFNLFSSRLLP